MGRKNLDGDRTVEARIARPIHFAHAARAQRRENLIGTEFGARRECHECVLFYGPALREAGA